MMAPADEMQRQSFFIRRRSVTLYIVIFCLAAGVYLNSIPHEFAYDDFSVFTNNAYVRKGVAGIPEIFTTSLWSGIRDNTLGYYRPMSLAMFALEHQLFPGVPAASHAVNVTLYAVSCVTGLLLLRLLFTGAPWWISFLAMAVFAAHPTHTEAVANIKGRDEILCFLGLMAALVFWIRYMTAERYRAQYLALSAVFFTISLLSKENAVMFFALAPLAAFACERPPKRNILVSLLPMAMIIGLYALFKIIFLGGVMGAQPDDMLAYPFYGKPFWGTLLPTAAGMLGKYVLLLIYPHPLVYDYSFNQFPARSWGDYGAILALALVIAAAWAGKRLRNKMAFFGLCFFCATISIPLGFTIIKGGIMGERFLLTPSYGFCVFLSGVAWTGCRSGKEIIESDSPRGHAIAAIAFSVSLACVVTLGALTVLRNRVWKDNATLFSSDIGNCADNARAHYNLGSEIVNNLSKYGEDPQRAGKLMEFAVAEFRKAIEIYPGYTDAHNNLGIAYLDISQWDKAIEEFRTALSLDMKRRYLYNNLASAYLGKNDFRSAAETLQKALSLGLKTPMVYYNLGLANAGLGTLNDAIACFEEAVRLDPDYKKSYLALANVYSTLGQKEKSAHYMELFNERQR